MAVIPACAIELICRFEGYAKALPDGSAQAYPDPKVGWQLPTIGFGTTRYPDNSPVRQGDVISRAKAEQCLLAECQHKCQPKLEQIPAWSQMNDNQRGALYSFAYNLGANFYQAKNFESITKVCDSPTLWQDQKWVTEQFVKYRNPGSPVENGLRKRREAEAALFCQPV